MANVEQEALPESLTRLNPTLFRALPELLQTAARAASLTRLAARWISNNLGELPPASASRASRWIIGLTRLVRTLELRLLDNDSTASAILEAFVQLAHRYLAAPAFTGRRE